MPETIDVKLWRAGDEAFLQAVAPLVFDDPPDAAATAAFLHDPLAESKRRRI